jgi:hypothetical protein
MIVLECTGQPGSGKSTLNRELLAHCMEFGVQIRTPDALMSGMDPAAPVSRNPALRQPANLMRRLQHRWWFFRFGYTQSSDAIVPRVLEKHRATLALVSDATRRNREIPWMKEWARNRLMDQLCVYEHASSYLGERDLLWIEDEGFVRGVTNVYGRYDGDDVAARIAEYVCLCPKVDIILRVKVDAATSLRRIRSRDGGRMLQLPLYRGMTDDEYVRRFKGLERVYELAVGAFRCAGARIVEIDTTNTDVESAVKWCREQLSIAIAQLVSEPEPEEMTDHGRDDNHTSSKGQACEARLRPWAEERQ